MPDVLLFERAPPSFAAGLAQRGHHVVYRSNEANHCPGCGRSQWYIGRMSAECGFCGTAVALAETARREPALAKSRVPVATASSDQRQHPRMPTGRRKLKLLIDGSPSNFAIHNISQGGVMGDLAQELVPGTHVQVRFEGGILVPAEVKWTDNGMVGLAFVDPIALDRTVQPRN